MTSYLGHYEFYAETYDVCSKYLGENRKKSIEEQPEKFAVGVAYGHEVLQSDVPHSEQAAGEKRDYYSDHRALGVIAVVDMHTRTRSLVRREKERVEAVENRVQLAESAPFLKLRLNLVDVSF